MSVVIVVVAALELFNAQDLYPSRPALPSPSRRRFAARERVLTWAVELGAEAERLRERRRGRRRGRRRRRRRTRRRRWRLPRQRRCFSPSKSRRSSAPSSGGGTRGHRQGGRPRERAEHFSSPSISRRRGEKRKRRREEEKVKQIAAALARLKNLDLSFSLALGSSFYNLFSQKW